MSPSRKLFRPPADLGVHRLPTVSVKSLVAYRVHSESFPAVFFRNNPSHRFSHPDAPEDLLYLGESEETCLLERFGDAIMESRRILSRAQWEHSKLSEVKVSAGITLCDLTIPATMIRLGVDLGTLMQQDLAVTQDWALAIQNHPSRVDGIRFASRYDGRACVVLFDRPRLRGQFQESSLGFLPWVDAANRFLADHSIALV